MNEKMPRAFQGELAPVVVSGIMLSQVVELNK